MSVVVRARASSPTRLLCWTEWMHMRDNLDLNGGRTPPLPQQRDRERKGRARRGRHKSEGERLLRIPRQCHYDRRAGGWVHHLYASWHVRKLPFGWRRVTFTKIVMTSDCMGGDQRETRARSVGRWWTSHRLTASRVFSGLAALSFVTLPSIVFVFKRGDHKAHYLTRANTNAAPL